MKERPILFSDAMVRAILEGRKTQTRRVVKPQPADGASKFSLGTPTNGVMGCHNKGRFGLFYRLPKNEWFTADKPTHNFIACPYGTVGDRLWVREIFAWHSHAKELGQKSKQFIFYKAQNDEILPENKWRPSIHMPRWASRITLEITGVRVERVKEISEEDVKAESFSEWTAPCGISGRVNGKERLTGTGKLTVKPIAGFMMEWEFIYSARGFGWDVNPWVWVIEFRRVA